MNMLHNFILLYSRDNVNKAYAQALKHKSIE